MKSWHNIWIPWSSALYVHEWLTYANSFESWSATSLDRLLACNIPRTNLKNKLKKKRYKPWLKVSTLFPSCFSRIHGHDYHVKVPHVFTRSTWQRHSSRTPQLGSKLLFHPPGFEEHDESVQFWLLVMDWYSMKVPWSSSGWTVGHCFTFHHLFQNTFSIFSKPKTKFPQQHVSNKVQHSCNFTRLSAVLECSEKSHNSHQWLSAVLAFFSALQKST